MIAHTPESTSKTTYLSPEDPSSIPESPNPAEDEVQEREELRRRLSERMMTLQQEMNSLRSTLNSLSPAGKTSNKDWPSTRNLQPDEPRSRPQKEASPQPDEPRSRPQEEAQPDEPRSRPQEEASPFTAAYSSKTFPGPSLQKLPRPLMTQCQGQSRSTSQGEGHTNAYHHLQREALQHVYQPEQQAAFQRQQSHPLMPENQPARFPTESSYNAEDINPMTRDPRIKILKHGRPNERLFFPYVDYTHHEPTNYQRKLPTTQEHEAFNYQYQPPNQTNYFHSQRTTPVKTFGKTPYFSGRQDEWESFWIQFSLYTRTLRLTNEEKCTELILALKGNALQYISNFNDEELQDFYRLSNALKERFGQRVPKETHRATLNTLRKSSQESIQEYASRVRTNMAKAYPEIEFTETFAQLSIQHFLNGLPESDLTFEVLKSSPTSLSDAVDSYIRLDALKQQCRKKVNLRQIHNATDESDSEEEDQADDQHVRRINGKKFVTEERLHQFSREIQSKIQRQFTDIKEMMKKMTDTKLDTKEPSTKQHAQNEGITCYNCGEEGHIRPNCPQMDKKDAKKGSHSNQTLNYKGLSMKADTQPHA